MTCPADRHSGRAAGLYQAGPKNIYFRPRALAGWLLNAVFQAALMFVMVIFATQAIYADRSSGTTFSHWEVTPGSQSFMCSRNSEQVVRYLPDAPTSSLGDPRLCTGSRKPS